MSEFTLNIQPMWNPTSGQSLERILRTKGANSEAPYIAEDNVIIPYIEESLYFESNIIYMEMPLDKDNLKQRLKVSGFYLYIQDGASIQHFSFPSAAIAGYITEPEDWTDKDKRIKIISSLIPSEDITKNVSIYWHYEIQKYNIITNTWVTTFKTPWPIDEQYDTVSFHFADQQDICSYKIDINMPCIPIFATQNLAENYINDPFNPTIYTQALNYYDPNKYSQPVDTESYKYNTLSKMIKNYPNQATTENANSSSAYIENILTPIDSLLAGYRNISYDSKIAELKNKIAKNLISLNDYKTMELIEAPTTTQGQVTWPHQAPMMPVRTFSPFTREELNTLVSWASSYCTGHNYKPSERNPFLLIAESVNTIDSQKYYNMRMVQAFATDIEKNGHFKIIVSNEVKDKDYYFLNYNTETKLTYAKNGYANHVTFKFNSENGISDIVSCGNNAFNVTHGNSIILDILNERVPFYSSHDIYAIDNKETVYKLFEKTDSDTVSRNDIVAADVRPAGMVHIKPILLLFNRYEMSYVNGWDGNKVKVADGYIMAPRMGAGRKEEDNSFTGIVMGVQQENVNSRNKQKIGLFGFNYGIQSLFLNSKDGSAIFGVAGSGQITIDPSTKKGLLYSGNYWKDFTDDGKPKNYNKSNENGQGMLIDLTTPEIKFGSGKFLVTSEGEMTAQGGGHIARWDITDYTIESNVTPSQGKLVLHSGIYKDQNGNEQYGYGYIYSGHHNYFGSRSKGFYLSHSGLSICNGNRSRLELNTDGDPVIYSGSHNTVDSNAQGFYLGQDGLSISGRYYDNVTDPNHEHPITSKIAIRTDSNPVIYSGGHSTLNSSSKGFYLSQDGLSISNGSTSRLTFATNGDPVIYSGGHSTLASTSNGFYLGNDGLSIGSGFKIQTTGNFSLTYNATEFGCTHLDDPIYYTITGNANSIYLGIDGLRLGTQTAVDNKGNLLTKHLIVKCGSTETEASWIGNWQFTNENFGAVYKVSNSQWDRLWMSTHGIIQAEQWNKEPFPEGVEDVDYDVVWALNTDGTAKFSNLDATVPSGKTMNIAGSLTVGGTATISGSLTAAGFTINNTTISGTNIAIDSTLGKITCDIVDATSVRATNFTENGTLLSSKYATLGTKTGTCTIDIGGTPYTGTCSITL